jgi:hypothetical protein
MGLDYTRAFRSALTGVAGMACRGVATPRHGLSRRCHAVVVLFFTTKKLVHFYCFGSTIDLTLLTFASSFEGVARP